MISKENRPSISNNLKMGMKETIEWYDRNAAKYAESNNLVETKYIDNFTKLLPENAEVIDVGSGAGHKAQALANKGLKVTGVDLSVGLINEAKKRYPELNFIMGDMLYLPFQDNFFDGVWSNASLVHLNSFEDAKKAIKEMGRVAKTGAVISLRTKEQLGEEKFEVTIDKLSDHNRFFQYYTIEEIKELLEIGGFHDIIFVEKDADTHGRANTSLIYAMARKTT